MNSAKSDSGQPMPAEPRTPTQETILAHLSDPHLSSLHGVRKRDLLSKRVLGYLSWRTRRRREHLGSVLSALVRDIHRARPDHVVVTGDMTHIGLPSEFQEVQTWLRELGPPPGVTIIPGNHDAYVGIAWDRSLGLWAPYMVSDPGAVPDRPAADGPNVFPSLRVRGSLALIGLSTARPSPPWFATGSLGRRQRERLEKMLMETGEQGLFRTVLVHHPPLPGTEKWRKRLTDNAALCKIMARCGVELVLHGHTHRATVAQLETTAGMAPVIGVTSASAIGHRPGRTAEYNLYRLSRTRQGWNMIISVRGFAVAEGHFVTRREQELTLYRQTRSNSNSNRPAAASPTPPPESTPAVPLRSRSG
jgi:3',5'-cyclic AMP phosphodiesterase CpdA